MNNNNRAYQAALFNHENAGFVYVELLALSAGIGFYYFSLKVFLTAYLVSLFVVKFRYTRIIVLQSLNIGWSLFGFMTGVEHSSQVGIVSALIMYVIISRLHSVDNCWI